MPLPTASTHINRISLSGVSIDGASIKGVSIPMLLDWWQHRKRVANRRTNLHRTLPKGDEHYLQSYYRLMEVYSVVKSGGVKAQIEAVKAFSKRESALLDQQLAQIAGDETLNNLEKQQARKKITQEVIELEAANNWRLQALTAIDPAEEALVKQHLPAIESTLMSVQCA